jgi:Arc/MetJ-type ribon-helix-helix transcriptional regulator
MAEQGSDTAIVNVRVPISLKAQLEQRARERGDSATTLIRQALREWLTHNNPTSATTPTAE